MQWQTSRYLIDLAHPRVMGIVNLTPDSFADQGRHGTPWSALVRCEQLLKDGADILDLGAESSRPSASAVPLEEELRRLIPVLKEALTLGVPVSVDTYKSEVMRVALDLGADIINDISALREPDSLSVVAAHSRCGLCLMHMQGEPILMQQDPCYTDVVAEVRLFLKCQADKVRGRGVAASRIVLDPGIGFGKTPQHNVALLSRQSELLSLGYPLLLGWSRKSTLGSITGRAVSDRMVASVAAGLAAVQHGAKVLRVHDVAEMVDALKVWRVAGCVQ